MGDGRPSDDDLLRLLAAAVTPWPPHPQDLREVVAVGRAAFPHRRALRSSIAAGRTGDGRGGGR